MTEASQSIGESVVEKSGTASGTSTDPVSTSKKINSIRSILLRVVLLLVAPAAIGLGILSVGFYKSEREQFSQSVHLTANALTSALDRDLGGTILAMRVLAESQSITAGDFARFHREASDTLPLLHG